MAEKHFEDAFAQFLKEFEEKKSVPEKIRCALAFMRSALVDTPTPKFKFFWESRQRVLPLFKKITSVVEKKPLWEEYIALGREAKEFKKLVEEKAAFISEQIEFAILAVEKDLKEFPILFAQVETPGSFETCQTIATKREDYITLYKEAYLLGTLAERLLSLRREILSLEIPYRQKNLLLEHIRRTGDEVFPKKREIVERLSHDFVDDVTRFAKKWKGMGGLQEVKDLQQMTKLLPLNHVVYKKVHALLQKCWDQEQTEENNQVRKKQVKSSALHSFKSTLHLLLEEEQPLESLINKKEELREHLRSLDLNDLDREDLEALFRRIEDKIDETKAIALLREEGGDIKERLKMLLEERGERRKKIKDQLEVYRKRLGGSDLDIESAMTYRDLLEAEKEALERIEDSIHILEMELEKRA